GRRHRIPRQPTLALRRFDFAYDGVAQNTGDFGRASDVQVLEHAVGCDPNRRDELVDGFALLLQAVAEPSRPLENLDLSLEDVHSLVGRMLKTGNTFLRDERIGILALRQRHDPRRHSELEQSIARTECRLEAGLIAV